MHSTHRNRVFCVRSGRLLPWHWRHDFCIGVGCRACTTRTPLQQRSGWRVQKSPEICRGATGPTWPGTALTSVPKTASLWRFECSFENLTFDMHDAAVSGFSRPSSPPRGRGRVTRRRVKPAEHTKAQHPSPPKSSPNPYTLIHSPIGQHTRILKQLPFASYCPGLVLHGPPSLAWLHDQLPEIGADRSLPRPKAAACCVGDSLLR